MIQNGSLKTFKITKNIPSGFANGCQFFFILDTKDLKESLISRTENVVAKKLKRRRNEKKQKQKYFSHSRLQF
jgi:hypothetical protein